MTAQLQNALWISSIVMQIAVASAMVLRGLENGQRTFFVYIAFQAVKSLCLVPIRTMSYTAYFWAYWIAEAATLILMLAVLQDIYDSLLQDSPRLRRGAMYVFWTAAIAFVFVVASTATIAEGTEGSRLMAGVLSGERSLRIVQCGILLFLLGFSVVTKVPWNAGTKAIAFGMGVFIASELLIVSARSIYGPSTSTAFRILKPFAYNIALVIWVRAFVFSPRTSTQPQVHAAPVLAELNHSLSEITR